MAQVGLAQVWASWQAREHPKRDTGSGRWTSESRAGQCHSPAPAANRRSRTVPLVLRTRRSGVQATAGQCHKCNEQHGRRTLWLGPLNGTGGSGASLVLLASEGASQEGHRLGRAGRWTSGSRAVQTLARPSRQPPPPDSATSAPHAPARRAGHRRTMPLVPRATRTAHDAAGTAEWHRWAWRKFGRPGKRGRTPRGTQAQGGGRLGAGPYCHSHAPADNRRRRTVPLVPRTRRPGVQVTAGQCH